MLASSGVCNAPSLTRHRSVSLTRADQTRSEGGSYRLEAAAFACVLLLASGCVNTEPTRPRQSKDVVSRSIQLTNFMSGPGTWQYKIQHINPPYVWYLVFYYPNGDTVETQVSQGQTGSLEPLGMVQSVRIDVVWCRYPIGTQPNSCGYGYTDDISGAYYDQTISLDPPIVNGPGDDFVVEFILPASCPATATCASAVEITPDHPNYLVGETATFTATVNGSLPTQVVGWTWNSSPVPDCGVSSTCKLPLSATGTIGVSAVVNGVTETASLKVSVNPLNCPTGDPLLDDAAVRRALVDGVKAGHGLEHDRSTWIEFDAAMLGTEFGRRATTLALLPGANACQSKFVEPDPADIPGDTVLAFIHVHPGVVGQPVPCPEKKGATLRPGPSSDDEDAMRQIANNKAYQREGWDPPWLIIDNYYVYKAVVKNKTKVTYVSYTWNQGKCNWDQFSSPDRVD